MLGAVSDGHGHRLELGYNLSLVPLSIVIPAYNEEKRLPETLNKISSYIGAQFPTAEVIVVDDGSRDATAALVEAQPGVRLVRNPGNRGKGYAVRNGMLNASGEWILFSDADLSTPIAEVEKLLAAAKDRGASVAIGSRALDRTLLGKRQSVFREFSGRVFNLVMRLLTGLSVQDSQCGFKLYHHSAARAIFPRQRLEGFSFDVEDLVIAKLLNFQIVEIPVIWNNAEGTKVSVANGLQSFADLMQIRKNVTRGVYERPDDR